MFCHKPPNISVAAIKKLKQSSLLNFCTHIDKVDLRTWIEQIQSGNQNQSNGDLWVNVRRFLDTKIDSRNIKVDKHVEKNSQVLDRDVAKIIQVLKAQPQDIQKALDECGVKVSAGLVEQVFKKFNTDWSSALGFFKWVGSQCGYKHTPEDYDTMVDILGKMKQFQAMWNLIEEMKLVGGLISLRTFTKAMRRYGGAEKWEEAIRTFNDMEEFGVEMDTAAMNVLLDVLCKEKKAEHVWDVFVDLKDRIPPDAHTFNALIHGWCKARKFEEAEWTIEEMKRHGFSPCVVSYTNFIEAYCLDKDFHKVDKLLDEMQEKGCPPNVVTYTIVMRALGKAKKIEEALRMYDRIKANGCTPDIAFYNSLIFVLGKGGRLKSAYEVLRELPKTGITPNIVTYNTLLAVTSEFLEEENALRLFREMEENNCKPDLQTYNPLLKMCCRMKRMKILSYLLEDMLRKDCVPDLGTYSLIVYELSKVGMLDQACQFFEEMIEKKIVPKHITYRYLVGELERVGNKEQNRRIQELIKKVQHCKPTAKIET
ncbi:hypothetical protein SUGI_0495010 [Cryptomeria japonica]|nr:hypothetical protein SUGI_0495010 [Cryptomeria japonica]